jgi:hypothetical protein
MSADLYLRNILLREAVDAGPYSPVRGVQRELDPILRSWAGTMLSGVSPSGSFAKGTANRSGTDIDLFISLSHQTTNGLKEIYETLFAGMNINGYRPKRQNVSINVRVNGFDVDLVPARRHDAYSQDHSLYRRRADTWTKTNVQTHVRHVISAGRLSETRILKLWRNQEGIDFPSFYLELIVIAALWGRNGSLADNVWTVLRYLQDSFADARVVDPANTNNVISEDLSVAERQLIRSAARQSLAATDWNQVVQ